jgi:hypothetical protein
MDKIVKCIDEFKAAKQIKTCEIWSFHDGEDDDLLLGFGAMQTCR